EVIFLDPYFFMYKHLLTMAGAKSVPVSSYPDFRFPAARVEQAITPQTKMLILHSPANPTGVVMSEAEVQQAVEIARKHDLLLLSDEIYEPFQYDGRVVSPAKGYDRTILLRGFSKSHAMTGWRLGYAVGPAEIIAQMTKLQQYTYVCAPAPLQLGALEALDLDMSSYVAAYGRKREIASESLSRKFEVGRSGGAFYLFPQVPAGITATEFVKKAIDRNVLVIPGNVFSEQDTHFRVSYATTDEQLKKGCDILCE